MMLARMPMAPDISPEMFAQIERRALEIAAVFEKKDGPYFAEVISGCEPRWHMIRAVQNCENKAAGQLSDRGFGVFVPKFDKGSVLRVETDLPRGRTKVDQIDLGGKLIFPGRLLLFAWDIMHHWRRVTACPAVLSIMLDGTGEPATVPDGEIDRIQALQFSLTGQQPKKRRKRYKSAEPDEPPRIESSSSFWTAEPLPIDGEARNRLLDRSLGLAS